MAYEYIYGVDVWEGSLDIEEQVLKEAGIAFAIIRLNDMRGGHKLDKSFARQWIEAEAFIRWPYFVYNPWVTGKTNFEFMAKNMPECGAVSVDIEVRYTGYSPVTYAKEVAAFLELGRPEWNLNIYTGYWFLGHLSTWPKDCEYWWAQYPYILYPETKLRSTWSTLIQRIAGLKLFPTKSPGPCRLRQVTADRYILPGCAGRPIDINVWNGSLQELVDWANGKGLASRPEQVEGGEGNARTDEQAWREAIDAWAREMGFRGPVPGRNHQGGG